MRREVSVWCQDGAWQVTSRSSLEDAGVDGDSWVRHLEGSEPDAAALGEAVRAGLMHSTGLGRLPAAHQKADLAGPEALLVRVELRGQRLRVAPMRWLGDGLGYGAVAAAATTLARSGLDSEVEGGLFVAPGNTAIIDGSIGAIVLQAMGISGEPGR